MEDVMSNIAVLCNIIEMKTLRMYIISFALQLGWNTEFDPHPSYLQHTTILNFGKANPAMDDATPKGSAIEENDRIKYAESTMKGYDDEMEDVVSNIAVLCNII